MKKWTQDRFRLDNLLNWIGLFLLGFGSKNRKKNDYMKGVKVHSLCKQFCTRILFFINWQLMASLERFGEEDPFFINWRSCRLCLQSEWPLEILFSHQNFNFQNSRTLNLSIVPTAKRISVKNVRAWVTMVSYFKKNKD